MSIGWLRPVNKEKNISLVIICNRTVLPMEGYTCSICHKYIPNGLKYFTAHLRHSHSLSVSAPYSSGYQCGQDECQYVFKNFNSLIRHLRANHPIVKNKNNESFLFRNHMKIDSNEAR